MFLFHLCFFLNVFIFSSTSFAICLLIYSSLRFHFTLCLLSFSFNFIAVSVFLFHPRLLLYPQPLFFFPSPCSPSYYFSLTFSSSNVPSWKSSLCVPFWFSFSPIALSSCVCLFFLSLLPLSLQPPSSPSSLPLSLFGVVMNLWLEPVVTGLGMRSWEHILFFTAWAQPGLKVAAAERSFHSPHTLEMENGAGGKLQRTTNTQTDKQEKENSTGLHFHAVEDSICYDGFPVHYQAWWMSSNRTWHRNTSAVLFLLFFLSLFHNVWVTGLLQCDTTYVILTEQTRSVSPTKACIHIEAQRRIHTLWQTHTDFHTAADVTRTNVFF